MTKCPCYGEKFVEIYYDWFDPPVPPEKMYEGWVDDYGEWYKVQTIEYQIPRFDHASTRELNDVLQSLAITI